MSEKTSVSYRFGETDEQGIGWGENSGADWVFPESETKATEIFDSDGMAHQLVLCAKDGKSYDISGREGPTSGQVSKIWKDKVGTGGTDGTDVVPVLTFPEDRGEQEHFFLGHLESHIYVRPYSESDGYPSGIEFDVDMFEDGEPTTPSGSADDVPKAGDITFDQEVDAHRLQVKVTANMGEHVITGRQQYYNAQDVAAEPSNTETTEMGYQEAFSEPVLWPDIINSVLTNRVTGNPITGQTYTAVTDPVSGTRALQIAAAITFPSVTLGATGTFLVWYSGTIALTIGGDAVALTDHSSTTVGGLKLAYANTVNKTGAVVITPTGTATIWDVRAINSAISTNQRTYLYNKITGVADNGDEQVMIPLE